LDNAATWEEYEDIAYRLDAYDLFVRGLALTSGNWEMIFGDRILSINITITNSFIRDYSL